MQCSQLKQAWSESGADGEQINTRALVFSWFNCRRLAAVTMTQRPVSQIHNVAAHQSRKDDIPRESACHPHPCMHEAEARGLLSQAAVGLHLQCRVQKG